MGGGGQRRIASHKRRAERLGERDGGRVIGRRQVAWLIAPRSGEEDVVADTGMVRVAQVRETLEGLSARAPRVEAWPGAVRGA